MNRKNFWRVLLVGVVVSSTLGVGGVHAQEADVKRSLTIAAYYEILGDGIENGYIVQAAEEGYTLTDEPYDDQLYGVVTTSPSVALNDFGLEGHYPLVSSGVVEVAVTAENGAIEKGDYITSSQRPGIGMKATRTGTTLGVALEKYNPDDPTEVGVILASFRTSSFVASDQSGEDNPSEVSNVSSLGTFQQPLTILRYGVSALIVLVSIFLGIFYFGRIAVSGIEAMGRNPLAGRKIQVGIILSIILAMVVVGAGVAVAVFILRL
jgi:hypothetical protein